MKKLLFWILSSLFLMLWVSSVFAIAPSYQDDFAGYLVNSSNDDSQTVFNLWIRTDRSLWYNIMCTLYPSAVKVPGCDSATGTWWFLRDTIRIIWIAIFFIIIVSIGISMLISSTKDSEDFNKSIHALYYVLIWWLLFFWATWLMWTIINFQTLSGSDWIVESLSSWPDSLFFKLMTLLKALAYFIAIVLIVVYGFKILSKLNDPEEAKKWIKWVWVVLWSLAIIKVIDYVYYIAQQATFAEQWAELIIEIAKICWFLIWWVSVIMVIYAGYLLITDQWSWEKMTQAKNIFVNILLVALVIFMFLLIWYQVFKEFA